MECLDAEAVLSRALDGDGDAVSVRQVRQHLSECQECREMFADLVLVRTMGKIASSRWGCGTRRLPDYLTI